MTKEEAKELYDNLKSYENLITTLEDDLSSLKTLTSDAKDLAESDLVINGNDTNTSFDNGSFDKIINNITTINSNISILHENVTNKEKEYLSIMEEDK